MVTGQLRAWSLAVACLTAAFSGRWLPVLAQAPSVAQGDTAMCGGVINSAAAGGLEDISNRLLSREIELMQMTTRFRLNNRRETSAHKWAVAVLSTAAYSVANAGNITTFTNGFRYHTQPQNLTRGRAQSGPLLILLGELLFVARSGLPTMIDAYNAVRVHDRGFDKQTFEHHALQLHAEIQQLLKERAQAADASPSAQSEQAVLAGIAAVADREFITNYARAIRMQKFRLWDNLLKNATSSSGAFAGALPTYLAGVQTRPRLTGPGGIGFICSGTLFASHLAVARWLSLRAEKNSKAELASRLVAREITAQELQRKIQELNTVAPEARLDHAVGTATAATAGTGTDASSARLRAYGLILSAAIAHDGLDNLEQRQDKQKFWHDEFINAVEGGANIAAGSELTNAGFHYHPHPDPLSHLEGARHFLTRFAWGAVTFTPTASIGIVETPGAFIAAELVNRRDCPGGPGWVLQERLNNLNQAAQLSAAP